MKHNLLLVGVVCVVALLFGAITVTAQGPSPNHVAGALGTAFTYQGQMSKNGVPVNGDVSMTFKLYNVASGGSPLGSNTQVVSFDKGVFTVVLDFGNVFDGNERWLGITVSGNPELSPRQWMGPAPYALYAKNAGTAASANTAPWSGLSGVPSTLNFLANPGCANNQVAKWNGSAWQCSSTGVGDITAVNAGTGLTGGGTSGDVTLNVDPAAVQARISGVCTSGNAIRSVNQDGTVTCEATYPGGGVTSVYGGAGLWGGGTTGAVTLTVAFAGSGVANTVARSDHTHSAADITSGTLNDARLSGNVILNGANITRLNNDAGYMTYGDLAVSGFITKTLADATYAPINHQHSAADITSGTLSDARLSANVVLSGTNVSRLNNDAGYVSAGALSAAGYITKTLADATYAPLAHQHSAADISSGTLDDARLSSRVVLSGTNISRLNNDAGYLTNAAGYITKTLADNTYAAIVHQHSAADITSGTLNDSRLSANVVLSGSNISRLNNDAGYLTNAAGFITKTLADASYAPLAHQHSATDITSGTLNDLRLSGNVVLSGANVSRLNNDAGYLTASALAGAGFITKTLADATYAPLAHQHSAADITSGTLNDSRLSGNVVLSSTNVSRLNNDAGYLTASALASAGYITKTLADATYAAINHQHSAADITSGTLNDLRLSANVVLSGSNISRLSNDAGYVTVAGVAAAGYITKTLADNTYAAIVHQHSAADITSGTLNDARLSSRVVLSGTNVSRLNNDAGYVTVAGVAAAGYITKTLADNTYAAINHQHSAADITSGTLSDARLSANVVLSGTNVSRLNNDAAYLNKATADTLYAVITHTHSATDIVTGTLADARLSSRVVLSGTNVSRLNNDAGYVTLAGVASAGFITRTLADSLYAPLAHTHSAGDIVTGTLNDARLSANVVLSGTPISRLYNDVGYVTSGGAMSGYITKTLADASYWHMDGNSGTSATTNYLGTTDAQPLVLKTNGAEVARIDAGGKVGIGTNTPNEQLEITGNFRLPQTDVTNFGTVGVIYMGWNTLMHAYGTDNYFAGLNAGNLSMTGHANAASGPYALQNTTNGSYNTASGAFALQNNSSGFRNTASGANALQTNDTGFQNTADGAYALVANVDGYNNTASGNQSLFFNTSGANNTAVGSRSLFNTMADGNIGVGEEAGFNNSSGTNNTYLGFRADGATGALTNATAIGAHATVASSNALVLGGTGVYSVSVGIGTQSPLSTLQVVGNYIQFPTISGSGPAGADCASASQYGRVVVRTDGTTNLYVCTSTGWVGK